MLISQFKCTQMNSTYKKKILLVHNDSEKVQYLHQCLAKYSFTIVSAENGTIAFEMAKKEKPDIIIASTRLADIDGFDLCWMIRQSLELKTVPYILMTDAYKVEERINGYRSGVDAFLENDSSIREIYTLIETTIKRIENMKANQNIPANSLQGKLPHFTVIEILQLLNISHKSGTLTFYNENVKGAIGFWDGKIVWAELDGQHGEEAVKKIAFWNTGHFFFEKDLIHPTMNIQTPTMQLILDCCQLLDEKANQS